MPPATNLPAEIGWPGIDVATTNVLVSKLITDTIAVAVLVINALVPCGFTAIPPVVVTTDNVDNTRLVAVLIVVKTLPPAIYNFSPSGLIDAMKGDAIEGMVAEIVFVAVSKMTT